MSHETRLSRLAVIVPALDEAETLARLLPRLDALGTGQILVCDNGSTDETHAVTRKSGALWVYEPRRGYGAACAAGVAHLANDIDAVAFVDADQGEEVDMLPALAQPVLHDRFDLVIGSRVASLRAPGAATTPQRLANWLVPRLIHLGWGHRYTDLGPFRVIKRSSLQTIDMSDRSYGWTIEMQVRAVELGLRIREIPVPHRPRQHGRSKITGTVGGVLRAGCCMLRTCAWLWLTRNRRLQRRQHSVPAP